MLVGIVALLFPPQMLSQMKMLSRMPITTACCTALCSQCCTSDPCSMCVARIHRVRNPSGALGVRMLLHVD